jgi:hypothetical protein
LPQWAKTGKAGLRVEEAHFDPSAATLSASRVA